MEDFVKKAFADAVNASDEAEYQSFKKEVSERIGLIATAVAISTGIEKVERMSKAVISSGEGSTLAEFIRGIVSFVFHAGYTEGRKSV